MARSPIKIDICIMVFMGMLFNVVGACIQIGAFSNKSLSSCESEEAQKVQQPQQQSQQKQPPQEQSLKQQSQQTQSGSRQVSVQQ